MAVASLCYVFVCFHLLSWCLPLGVALLSIFEAASHHRTGMLSCLLPLLNGMGWGGLAQLSFPPCSFNQWMVCLIIT